MQKYIDLHTHSSFSFDGVNSVTEMVSRAEELGLFALAITDHCEMNDFEVGKYHEKIEGAIDEIDRIFEESAERRLLLLKGMEMGQALERKDLSDQFYEHIFPKTDFILASLHNLIDYPDFYYLDYDRENVPDLLKRYFTELNNLAQWGKFDSMAHITYPMRYLAENKNITINLEPVRDLIDSMLLTIAERGLAVEVNTSGLRQPLGETMPSFYFIKRFKELGGVYVTVGSDAHNIGELGQGIQEGIEIIKAAGFQTVTYFKEHKPYEIAVE